MNYSTGEQIRGPLLSVTFHRYRYRNVGLIPPNRSKFGVFGVNLPLRGDPLQRYLQNLA